MNFRKNLQHSFPTKISGSSSILERGGFHYRLFCNNYDNFAIMIILGAGGKNDGSYSRHLHRLLASLLYNVILWSLFTLLYNVIFWSLVSLLSPLLYNVIIWSLFILLYNVVTTRIIILLFCHKCHFIIAIIGCWVERADGFGSYCSLNSFVQAFFLLQQTRTFKTFFELRLLHIGPLGPLIKLSLRSLTPCEVIAIVENLIFISKHLGERTFGRVGPDWYRKMTPLSLERVFSILSRQTVQWIR